MQEKLTEALETLADFLTREDRLGIDLGQGAAQPIPVASIAFVTLRSGRVVVVQVDGTEIEVRSSENLNGMADRLKHFGRFLRSHNSHLVNLDLVDMIIRRRAGEYDLVLTNGSSVPLSQNHEAVKKYFGLQSLDHVVPWSDLQEILNREGLRTFEKDIRSMTTDEVRQTFVDGTGALVTRQVIGNLVWQAYNWIKAGKLDPIDGNIRSFWYTHVKAVLARVLPKAGENQYKQMGAVIADYVGDLKLFRYADLGFIDENDALRSIGDKHPHVIVFAEKRGHWRMMKQIQELTGATVIALGGKPSLMTTEYFVAELGKVISLDHPIHLISNVDYDPSGTEIAESFQEQLAKMGAKQTTIAHIVRPERFDQKLINVFKIELKPENASDRTKLKNWLNPDKRRFPNREPGGIVDENGVRQPWGLQSDAMPKEDLINDAVLAVKRVTDPHLDVVLPEPTPYPFPVV